MQNIEVDATKIYFYYINMTKILVDDDILVPYL